MKQVCEYVKMTVNGDEVIADPVSAANKYKEVFNLLLADTSTQSSTDERLEQVNENNILVYINDKVEENEMSFIPEVEGEYTIKIESFVFCHQFSIMRFQKQKH